MIEWHVRLTMVPLKALYELDAIGGFSSKGLAYFLLKKQWKNCESLKLFNLKKKRVFFKIIDQIQLLRHYSDTAHIFLN